ncbi:MAG TPA: hypothetical protein VNM67_00050 [Thermoanaerobaculia bacterium]|jgi:hypothetical protein|nr:hypothetical protein [Thermoanaerobaculia bacterium]
MARIVRVLAILMLTLAAAALAQPSGRRPPAPRIEEICTADTYGKPRCIRISDLQRTLSPQAYQKILDSIGELYRKLGLDRSKDALVSCGSKGFGGVSLEGETPGAGKTLPLPADAVADLQKKIASCRSSISGWGGRGGAAGLDPGAGYDAWVAETVSNVEEDLSECRESGNGMIAQDPGEAGKRKTVGVFDMSLRPPAEAPQNNNTEGSSFFIKTKHEATASQPSGIGRASAQIIEELKKAMEKQAGSGSGGSGSGSGGSTGGSSGGTTGGSGTPGGSAGQPCPDAVDCGSSCEQAQAVWGWFKSQCEQSDWKAWPCVDFLRKARGCVDLALINPDPEGDLTCPGWGQDDEEQRRRAWVEACERKKWIISPLPDGEVVCHQADVPRPERVRIDICNDPRAMPGPDQCTGPAVPSGATGDRRPRPQPSPETKPVDPPL